MKLVIPTNDRKGLDGEVAEHFGRCKTYSFIDEKGNLIEIIENTSEHMGGTGLPPELMKKHGADILLCRGLGPRALDLCSKLGIEVYVLEAKTVKDIFQVWATGKMKKASMNEVCEEHRQ